MYSINVVYVFVLCVQFWFIKVEQCQGPIHKSQIGVLLDQHVHWNPFLWFKEKP